jgi:hypothetical protein
VAVNKLGMDVRDPGRGEVRFWQGGCVRGYTDRKWGLGDPLGREVAGLGSDMATAENTTMAANEGYNEREGGNGEPLAWRREGGG